MDESPNPKAQKEDIDTLTAFLKQQSNDVLAFSLECCQTEDRRG
jgi:hypothetical protein